VKNIHLLFIKATSVGASVSGTPPEAASGSSIPVDWNPVALANHLEELIVSADLGKMGR
jgi:hypothetical protein